MAIEIREIIIKATVAAEGGAEGNATATGGSDNLQACVDAVMQVLQDKNER